MMLMQYWNMRCKLNNDYEERNERNNYHIRCLNEE